MQLELLMKSDRQVDATASAIINDPYLWPLTDAETFSNKLAFCSILLIKKNPSFLQLGLRLFPSGLLKLRLLALAQ